MIKWISFLSLLATSSAFAHGDHGPGTGLVVSTQIETGSAPYMYATVPNWGVLPEEQKLGSLHGDLALDEAGNVYISTLKKPGVAKFSKHGVFEKFLKDDLQGCHSLAISKEGEKEVLWGGMNNRKKAVKFDLEGNILLTIPNEKTGDLDGGMGGLTEVLVGPDQTIYLFMGYGSNKIHRLRPDGTLIKTYGGKGKGKDQFTACHGAAFDFRYDEPRILVCDRDGRRMMHLTPDLEWIGLYGEPGMRRPADVDVRGDLAAVAEIEGRVILMDKDGKTVSKLLDNPNKKQWVTNNVKAEDLSDRYFTAPHGIKFDHQGRILVSEWNKAGRILALEPVEQ